MPFIEGGEERVGILFDQSSPCSNQRSHESMVSADPWEGVRSLVARMRIKHWNRCQGQGRKEQ